MDIHVEHQLAEQAFTAETDGQEAELTYALPQEGVIDFQHTFVPEGLRGKGVAEQLARTALAYAREKHLKVIPTCQFVGSFVRRHRDEYQDLLLHTAI